MTPFITFLLFLIGVIMIACTGDYIHQSIGSLITFCVSLVVFFFSLYSGIKLWWKEDNGKKTCHKNQVLPVTEPPIKRRAFMPQINKLAEIATDICEVCFDRTKNTALKCGHRHCQTCVEQLDGKCSICRETFDSFIPLYN